MKSQTCLVYLFCLFLFDSVLAQTASSDPSAPASFPTTTSQISCTTRLPDPVVIPYRNVTLSDGTLRRGLSISYGTPPQPFAMVFKCGTNNTYIFDGSAPCDSEDSRPECNARFGGLFDEGSSSTFKSYMNMTAPNLAPFEGYDEQRDDISGTDTLKINPNVSLVDFPVGIYRGASSYDGSPRHNIFGLGANSTAMRAMAAAGEVASATLGFFQGWTGANIPYQMDGSLVLGGYDQAKISGPNVTLPMNYDVACDSGFLVSITDITMNLKNGSNPSIMGSSQGSAIKACVMPEVDYISISNDIWDTFLNISMNQETGRSGGPINYWTMLIAAAGAYDGDLTVSIYPGLDIRIPNHQLVVPDYDVDPNGQTYIKNTTNSDILFLSLEAINQNDMPHLGKPFLSSAYLFADFDHRTFTLWQSKVTTNTNLIAIGPPTCSPSPPAAAVPTMTLLPLSDHSRNSIKGTVAGGVIGGIAALAIGISAFCLLARRRRKGRNAVEERDMAVRMEEYKRVSDNSYLKPEMSTDQIPPQELPLSRDTSYALAPYEVLNREKYELSSRRDTDIRREPLELPVEPKTPRRPTR